MKLTYSNPDKYKGWASWLFLFCTALFIRLPFFFSDYIDRDESTFILMGQSIADGHLPYVHLWDLKPPLLFYVFGLIETIFPHSFIAIRFCAVLVVFISAVILMKIARRGGLRNGFFIGVMYVMLASEFGNLQGFMSEHLAVMFMLTGIYFFQNKGFLSWFIAGLASGCALLCKLSFAYALVAFLAVHFLIYKRNSTWLTLLKGYLFTGLGILLTFLLIALPFIFQQKTEIFINSVFLAPLEYGNARHLGFIKKLETTWWVLAIGLVLSYLAIKKAESQNRNLAYLSVAVLLGTIYTFFSSGIVNGHYMILIYPFILLLLMGVIIKRQLRLRYPVIALIVLLLSFESSREYYTVFKTCKKTGSPYNGQSFEIVSELKKKGLANEKIFFLDYHIGYWLLNQYPLTRSTTHPSNINRSYLFKYFHRRTSTYHELKYIMDTIRPKVVVSKYPTIGFIPGHLAARHYFDSVIANEFIPVFIKPKQAIYIWKRK